MSRHGRWQLQRLSIHFCKFSGSSQGARDFIFRELPSFELNNPQLEITQELRPGRHPYLEGVYWNGNVRTVDCKNKTAESILLQSQGLRDAAGRKTSKPLETRHVLPSYSRTESTPSRRIYEEPTVQQIWRPGLFRAKKGVRQP